tara:strand:+ start:171 stop:281 length:111 start_codon:yes stop_codon:yes gene_type:complete
VIEVTANADFIFGVIIGMIFTFSVMTVMLAVNKRGL